MTLKLMGGYCPVKNTRTSTNGEKITLFAGGAFDENNKPYTGSFIEKTPRGDVFELKYKDALLDESIKNGQIYKKYYHVSTDDNIRHAFNDGSFLTYQQLWHFDKNCIKQIRNYEDKTKTFIMRNDENGLSNEPKVLCNLTTTLRNRKLLDKKIVKLNDFKEINFKTAEEAKKYFKKEYGIDINSIDLKTAHICKQALDAFADLNYKGKGKRLFEGMEIKNDENMKQEYFGQVHFDIEVNGKIISGEHTPEEYKILQEMVDKLVASKSKNIKTVNPVVCVTDNNIATCKMRDNYEKNTHNYQFLSSLAIHEFIHWLHIKENPNWVALEGDRDLDLSERFIAREVSGYACKNPAEYVAEYVAGRLEGRTFSSEADELYKKFNGPQLFD